jgi:hypothetical protein
MKLDFFMLADAAIVEKAPDGSSKLNIRGGAVTHVRASEFPYRLASITLVIRFFLADEEDFRNKHSLEIRLIAPDESQLLSITQDLDLAQMPRTDVHAGEDPSLFLVGELSNVLLEHEGRYVFELTFDGAAIDSKAIAAIVAPDLASLEDQPERPPSGPSAAPM